VFGPKSHNKQKRWLMGLSLMGERVRTHRPFSCHLDHRELAEGLYGYMIEDRHLRPALVDQLAATVDHRTGVRVSSVEYETGRAIATLDDGQTLAAPLLVACDGGNSPIAKAAGIRRIKWDYDQNGLVCAVGHELPHHGVAHEMFLPGGPFAILPLSGNRSSLVWTERTAEAARIHGLSDEGYVAELEKGFGDFRWRDYAGGRAVDLSAAPFACA